MEKKWIVSPSDLVMPPYVFKIFPLASMSVTERQNATVRLVALLTAAAWYHNAASYQWLVGIGVLVALGYVHMQQTTPAEMFYTKANEAAVAVQRKLAASEGGPDAPRPDVLTVEAERKAARTREAAIATAAKERAAARTKKIGEMFLDRHRVAEQLVTNVREQPQRTAVTWSKDEDIQSNRNARLDTSDEYESLFTGSTTNGDKYVMNRV